MATSPAHFSPTLAVRERRGEPRFGAEGEVTVILFDGLNDYEIPAKLLDFSLHGLRIRLNRELQQGQEVRVIFSWGEATTHVQWTTPMANSFETGLQLF
jgi:PilZ domain